MAKTKPFTSTNPNGVGPGKSGAKSLPQYLNMHFLDKPIVQSGSKLGSNKHNKVAKVGK